MALEAHDPLIRSLRTPPEMGEVGPTDAALLARFIASGDGDAFAALVRRHGALVLGTCRRRLGVGPDADDAFQATFLVLAKKAGKIRKREALASWLHGVAHFVSRNLQTQLARRRRREDTMKSMAQPASESEGPARHASLRELAAILDDEIQRLPASVRAPLLACHSEGLNITAAAHQMGVPVSTLKTRLARGRELLRERLARRGIGLSAVAPSLFLLEQSQASPALIDTTTQAALDFAAGAAAVSTQAVRLATSALRDAFVKQIKTGFLVGALMGLLGVTTAVSLPAAPPLPVPGPPAAALAQQPPFDVFSVAFSKDGKFMAAGGGLWTTGEIGVWDLETKKPLKRFAEDGGVASVAFSPDGKLLASGSETGYVRVRDWAAASEIANFDVQHLARLAIAPAGDYLVTATETKTVQLWDLTKRKFAANLKGDLYRFHCAAFSPDGKYALAGGGEWKAGGVSLVAVWDVETKKQVKKIEGHNDSVLNMCFSPDGKTFATCSKDKTIRISNWETGKDVKVLRGHGHWVESIVFTADGKTLVSCSHDGTIRFWDWGNAVEIEKQRIAAMPGPVRVVTFTPDWSLLVAAGALKTLKFFDPVTHHETETLWNGAPAAKAPIDEVPITAMPQVTPAELAAEGPEPRRGSYRTLSVFAVIGLVVCGVLARAVAGTTKKEKEEKVKDRRTRS
jgi:RNA polymerase sigma factor (sigma-70 family)